MRGLLSAQILGRELVEIAARRRTYVVRACIVLLLLAVYGAAQYVVESSHGARGLLARGSSLVTTLTVLMCIALSVMAPATAALSVVTEREQGTLVLLALTPMSLANQVIQKYLAQLLAAGALCMLAVPLLAVGYALGGMTASELLRQIAFVALLACQVTAVGLAASCLARTAIGAIASAYVWVILLHLSSIGQNLTPTPWWFQLSPYALLVGGKPMLKQVLASLGLVLGMLAIARMALATRLESSATTRLDRAVKRVDAGLEAIDARLFRLRPQRSLPDARPVCWREVSRASFCSWRFMIRWLLPAMALLALLALLGSDNRRIGMLWVTLAFFISCLFITIVGASLVNRERSDQTLDVLLTTQLSPRDIMREKMRALARLRWALTACIALPLATLWWQYEYAESVSYFPSVHISPWMAAIESALYLNIYCWMAVAIGLRWRPMSRAVVLSLAAVLASFLAVPVLQIVLGLMGIQCTGDWWCIACIAFSPGHLIADDMPFFTSSPMGDLAIGWLIAGGLWWLLAFSAGRRVQRWLPGPGASAA